MKFTIVLGKFFNGEEINSTVIFFLIIFGHVVDKSMDASDLIQIIY